jgi:hypothetical protein
VPPYSPERRTALVLTGTGAHGAYHAGALRALQEAGVKIDLVAGHGVGTGGAALAAIDGAARLWDADGIWRSSAVTTMYGWRRPLHLVAWMGAALVAVLLIPLLVLLAGLLVFLIGFFLEMVQVSQGASIISGYSAWLQAAFSGTGLPTVVPRAVTIVLAAIIAAVGVTAFLAGRVAGGRRMQGGWWWRIVGAPFDARATADRFASSFAAPRRSPGRRGLRWGAGSRRSWSKTWVNPGSASCCSSPPISMRGAISWRRY